MYYPQGSRINHRHRGPVESSKVSYIRNTIEGNLKSLALKCSNNESETTALKDSMQNLTERTVVKG